MVNNNIGHARTGYRIYLPYLSSFGLYWRHQSRDDYSISQPDKFNRRDVVRLLHGSNIGSDDPRSDKIIGRTLTAASQLLIKTTRSSALSSIKRLDIFSLYFFQFSFAFQATIDGAFPLPPPSRLGPLYNADGIAGL